MHFSNLAARLRRPAVVTASIAVIATSYYPAPVHSSSAPEIQRVVATPIPLPVFKPVRLVIPAIDVDNPVVPVWTEGDGKMGSPDTAEDVGWWAGRKAGKGNLLLDGHHDWNGKLGSFIRLPELKKGDEITVLGDKKDERLTYRVVWLKNYDRAVDATDLLGNKTKKQMATLITCAGQFDTAAGTRRERAVVRAELVTT